MFSDELQNAIDIVREAGNILLKYYHQDYKVEVKKGDGPVTEADKASNTFIVKRLKDFYPEDGILSEESQDNLSRLSKKRVWLVDPMDGTREFIDKNGQFVAMIGLAVDGAPMLGAVYQPTTDTLFFASKGNGAFAVRSQKEIPLTVSTTSDVAKMAMVVSRSHRSPLVDSIKKSLGIMQDVGSGSVGLKVGLLAEQKADLYIHPNSKTKEWDTCAPQIILEEAGGEMTDCWGNPLKYNKQNVYNAQGYVASNGQCHNEILEKINPLLSQMD